MYGKSCLQNVNLRTYLLYIHIIRSFYLQQYLLSGIAFNAAFHSYSSISEELCKNSYVILLHAVATISYFVFFRHENITKSTERNKGTICPVTSKECIQKERRWSSINS